MLFNIEWLKEYVEIDIPVDELVNRLNMIGLEVDGFEEVDGVPILDLDITPNRSDCMSYIGLAREISVLLEKPLKLPPVDYTSDDTDLAEDSLKIEIECPKLVRRFSGAVLKDVKISSSPDWMQRRLTSVGIRSLNDLVDITNYVLLETGHPMHAYDLDLLETAKLIAREAKNNEKVKTLDGEVRDLATGDLVIADEHKIVGLGGVMGGAETEISYRTRNVALEAAWFDPVRIRRTSKRLGLSTEASYRFERTADINGSIFGIKRCCYLVSQIMSAKIAKGTIDNYPADIRSHQISFRPERTRKFLGADITNQYMEDLFKKLEMTILNADEYIWKVTPPSFRSDLELEVDLIEEVARFYGYDRIEPSLPSFYTGALPLTVIQKIDREIKDTLVGYGLQQVINFSFSNLKEIEAFGMSESKSVRILNPIADDMNYMRCSLLPDLIKSAFVNYNYGFQDLKLFEVGKVFFKIPSAKQPEERVHLGIILSGLEYTIHWNRTGRPVSYYNLKGIIEQIPIINKRGMLRFQKSNKDFLNAKDSAVLELNRKEIGFLGKLDDSTAEIFGIDFPIYIAEIDLTSLSDINPARIKYKSISRYQPVTRDISFMIDKNVSYSDLLSLIESFKLDVLEKVDIFDIYLGDRIPEGKKNLAIRFTYLSENKSLTGEEIKSLQDKIIKNLKEKFDVKLQEK